MSKNTTGQTAYRTDNHVSNPNIKGKDHGWADQINRMLDQRYAFLNLEYQETGYLFRGIESGLSDALLKDQFWHSDTKSNMARLERELDIIFFSQDISDAISLSKLWESSCDAGLIIFESEIFNKALRKKRAAMMATAEPGVVFRYPLLTFPLSVKDLSLIVISTKCFLKLTDVQTNSDNDLVRKLELLKDQGKLVIYNNDVLHSRTEFENHLVQDCKARGISGSETMKSIFKPVMSSA